MHNNYSISWFIMRYSAICSNFASVNLVDTGDFKLFYTTVGVGGWLGGIFGIVGGLLGLGGAIVK